MRYATTVPILLVSKFYLPDLYELLKISSYLVSRRFIYIILYLNIVEELRLSRFFAKIRNNDFRRNHNYIMNLIVSCSVSQNRDNKRFR